MIIYIKAYNGVCLFMLLNEAMLNAVECHILLITRSERKGEKAPYFCGIYVEKLRKTWINLFHRRSHIIIVKTVDLLIAFLNMTHRGFLKRKPFTSNRKLRNKFRLELNNSSRTPKM